MFVALLNLPLAHATQPELAVAVPMTNPVPGPHAALPCDVHRSMLDVDEYFVISHDAQLESLRAVPATKPDPAAQWLLL